MIFRTGMYFSMMPWAAGGEDTTNKIYAADHSRVSQEQLVHQVDLDRGQDSLTVKI